METQTPSLELLAQIPKAPPITGGDEDGATGNVFEAPPPDVMVKALLAPDSVTPEEQATIDAYRVASQKAERRREMLGLVDLAEVMEGGDTEPDMLVDELLVRGMHHVIYGKKQSGKTWVLMVAAAELIRRGETVVWIDEEMGRQEIARRLTWIGVPADAVREHFVYMEFPALDRSPENLFLWGELLKQRQPALVVADAHTEVLAAADLNENSGTDVAKWNADYVSPARRLGSATAFIDHTGHDEQGRPVGSRHKGAQAKVELSVVCKEPFGTSKLGVIEITEQKNTIAAPISKKRYIELGGEGQPDGSLGFVFRPTQEPIGKATGKSLRKRQSVEDEVRTAPKPLSRSAIFDRVGGGKADTMKIIDAMIEDGLLSGQDGPRGATVYVWGGGDASE